MGKDEDGESILGNPTRWASARPTRIRHLVSVGPSELHREDECLSNGRLPDVCGYDEKRLGAEWSRVPVCSSSLFLSFELGYAVVNFPLFARLGCLPDRPAGKPAPNYQSGET